MRSHTFAGRIARPTGRRLAFVGTAALAVALVVPATGLRAAAAPAPATRAAVTDDTPSLAATPPMGWNSWNTFGLDINEQRIRDTADQLVATGMKDAGYDYLVVDGGWRATTRDANGDMQADPVKFPSGMKALGDYIHSKGLKFGLHQSVNVLDCGMKTPGTASAPDATYAQKAARDAATFASWGVDFVKFDWCGAQKLTPAGSTERDWAQQVYQGMRQGLDATGRPIVLSMSEYGRNKPWEWAPGIGAQMWRVTFDIAAVWDSGVTTNRNPMGVVNIIDQNAPLAAYAGPGHWNDAEMLEVGVPGSGVSPRLTDTEARAHFSMWATMAAPLIAGNDVTTMSPATLQTLTNRDVIAVDQDPLGAQGVRVRDDGDQEVWVKPLANGDRAVTLLNRGATDATITTTDREAGLPSGGGYLVKDLWTHTSTVSGGTIAADVPSHGAAMFRVGPGTPDAAAPSTLLTLQAPQTLTAGQPGQATLTLTNNGRIALGDERTTLTAPPGWQVTPTSTTDATTTVPPDGPARSFTTTWTVTPPSDATAGCVDLTARANWTWGDPPQHADTRTTRTVCVTTPTVTP